MPFTVEEKLKSVISEDCFLPVTGTSITLEQDHKLAMDGETKKDWTQKLTITNLEGNEIFFSFDKEDHKHYCRYIQADSKTFYAKACDYIMLKKINSKWTAYIGELKMKKISAPEVDMQTKGTQAFLEYIKALLNIDGFGDLQNLTVKRKVIGCHKPLVRARNNNSRRPVGRAQRRVVSAVSAAPATDLLDRSPPYNDIVATRLAFDDSHKNHVTITLPEFLATP